MRAPFREPISAAECERERRSVMVRAPLLPDARKRAQDPARAYAAVHVGTSRIITLAFARAPTYSKRLYPACIQHASARAPALTRAAMRCSCTHMHGLEISVGVRDEI